MRCSELMKRHVECCGLDDSVADVAARMRDQNIGFLPVCDASGKAIGTITDRDLAIRVLANRLSSATTRIDEVMTRGIVACRASDALRLAERLMSEHKVARIVCVDEEGRPVGVISLSDVSMVERGARGSELFRSVSLREVRPM